MNNEIVLHGLELKTTIDQINRMLTVARWLAHGMSLTIVANGAMLAYLIVHTILVSKGVLH